MLKKTISHISAVEQPSVIEESRDAFIEVGCKRFRTKPTVAQAFGMFRTQKNYSKVTDALNECLEHDLRVRGFLPKNTLEDVGIREVDMAKMSAEDEEILARYCAKHGLDWYTATRELLHKQLQVVKACNYLRREWVEEVEEEARKEA